MKRIIFGIVALVAIGAGFALLQSLPKNQGVTPSAEQQAVQRKIQTEKQRVVLISIDGARADFVRDFNLPNIRAMAKRGAYTYQAQTVFPSLTLPSHASMLSGYRTAKHGIQKNGWKPGVRVKSATIFDRLVSEGKIVKLMAAKMKFEAFKKPGMQFEVDIVDERSRFMEQEALKALTTKKYDFLFVHIKAPDRAGHDFGHYTKQYRQALMKADTSIGAIVAKLKELDLFDSTTVIVTSDHGMRGRDHGGRTPAEMTITWIISGPGIREDYHIRAPVSIMDTTATILWLFGIPIPADMDGRVPFGIQKN